MRREDQVGRAAAGESETGRAPRAARVRYAILVAFLIVCLLGGGASRPDVLSLLYLRPIAVICIAALLLTPGPWDFRTFRIPFLLLAGLAVAMLVQLIPLPPDLWLSLPGRARYAEAAAAAGLPQPWRPISLTPDLTWNSVVSLLPPLTVLIGLAGIRQQQRFALLPILIIGVCLGAVLGILQAASSTSSPLFLYEVSHQGSAVGFFANRNHQAALLAATFPILRMWTLLPTLDRNYQRTRFWIAGGIALLLVPMILVTGSRAGVALGLLGLLAAYFLAPASNAAGARTFSLRSVPRLALWVGPAALGFIAILLGRALAVERLFAIEDLQLEQRITNTPLMIEITRDFFPFGSGFGSFDPVFRGYEHDAMLSPLYFNRAHNDLIEMAMTGGLLGIAILALFLLWWLRRTISAFLPYRGRSEATLFGRLGSLMILLLLLASLVDYPLRTPLIAAVFVIACGWLADGRGQRGRPPPVQA